MDMSIWFLVGAILVFFMQCGFAMVETGFTRAKNAGNIIMKNLMDFCIGTIVFIFLGYGLMMGNHGRLGLIGVPDWGMFTDFEGFDWSSFVFQLVFCATAATIVSGAMAERTRFSAYCLYSAVISLIVYPIEPRRLIRRSDRHRLSSPLSAGTVLRASGYACREKALHAGADPLRRGPLRHPA